MKIICFGDTWGIPMLLKYLPVGTCRAIIAAEIRPQYFSEIKFISDLNSILFLIQPKKSSNGYKQFLDSINAINPDIILVNSYSMLLGNDILKIAQKGAFNIHGGILPQYRGCNPTQWALLNNEKETGVTIHYMDANFDTGDIVSQERIPIYETDTWVSIQYKLAKQTEEMLSKEIPKILNGSNSRVPQDDSLARYWKRRKPEDGLFDWNTWRTKDIYNLIRALVKPLPGAFYINNLGKRVILDSFVSYDQVEEMQKDIIGTIII